ncbi:hypothetical protein LOH53_09375 [Arthrobacter cryoconiti]|nr:hypothetical protein [Arthrobacter cryoconiti]
MHRTLAAGAPWRGVVFGGAWSVGAVRNDALRVGGESAQATSTVVRHQSYVNLL